MGFQPRTILTVCALLTAACGSPTAPGVSVVAAKPTSPSSGSSFSYYSQPVTLVVTPGVATGGVTPTSTVEIATDVAFTTVVSTQTVSSSASGQITLVLDHLSPATTYYWRVKSTAGSNPSVVSAVSSFTIGSKLVIDAPIPVEPLATTFPHKRPKMTVRNAPRTGPPATPTYTFEVSGDAGFTGIVARETAVEGQNQTSVVLATDLVPGATYFWRARASDAVTGVIGDYSPPQVFTTVFPEDGTYRYTLLVRSPTWCLTHYKSGSSCWPPSWLVSDFSFDASLTIEADTLRYRLPDAEWGPNFGTAIWDMRRTGNRLVGSVSGSTPYIPFTSQIVTFSSATISGEADNGGRFSGTFDGGLSLWYPGMPCDHSVSCTTSGFTWTLTLHP